MFKYFMFLCKVERINLKAGSDITRVKMANDTAAQLMK